MELLGSLGLWISFGQEIHWRGTTFWLTSFTARVCVWREGVLYIGGATNRLSTQNLIWPLLCLGTGSFEIAFKTLNDLRLTGIPPWPTFNSKAMVDGLWGGWNKWHAKDKDKVAQQKVYEAILTERALNLLRKNGRHSMEFVGGGCIFLSSVWLHRIRNKRTISIWLQLTSNLLFYPKKPTIILCLFEWEFFVKGWTGRHMEPYNYKHWIFCTNKW